MKLIDYLDQIDGLKLRSMTNEQLKVTLQNVAMHTNLRAKRLEKAGLAGMSKSYMLLHDRTGKALPRLSSKGASRFDMMRQIKMGKQFLLGQTSTVSGTRKMINKVFEAMSAGVPEEERSEIQEALKDPDFWSLLREIEELIGWGKAQSGDLIQETFIEYQKTNDSTIAAKNISKRWKFKTMRDEDLDLTFKSDDNLTRRKKKDK